MLRRNLTIPERWQAVGMHNGDFSHRKTANRFEISSLLEKILLNKSGGAYLLSDCEMRHCNTVGSVPTFNRKIVEILSFNVRRLLSITFHINI
jgi:hypothetical protein